jgi:hypothetical protein
LSNLFVDTELANKLCKGNPTAADYQKASQLLQRPDHPWILTEHLRKNLYNSLFVSSPTRSKLIFKDIVDGKIALLKRLQRFMVHHSLRIVPRTSDSDPLPNLRFVADDALILLEILQIDVPSPVPLQAEDNWRPFCHFDLHRRQIWEEKSWFSKSSWRSYKINLCDALFGFWDPECPDSFLYRHDEEGDFKPGSGNGNVGNSTVQPYTRDSGIDYVGDGHGKPHIQSVLRGINLAVRRADSVKQYDCAILEAAHIVTNGPFRFERTDYLHEHLSTEGKKIFIFTKLEKVAGLRHHRVLESPDVHQFQHTMFDILTSDDRYRDRDTHNIRHFISRLHHSLQSSISLLFLQQSLAKSDRLPMNPKSHKIAQSLGVDVVELSARATAILKDNPSWEAKYATDNESRLSDPFMVPLDNVYKTLVAWKPQSFLEMRHAGYGGVDVVALYGFWFAVIVGVVGTVGIGLTAAQTAASFRVGTSSP